MAVATALAGCGFSAGLDGGRFRCDGDQGCPDGLTCSAAGYCESDTGDAAPAGDAGVTADCGTTDALRESFDDPERFDWFWAEDSSDGARATAEDSRLRLELPAGPIAFAGRNAFRWYRFQDSGITFRVLEPPGGTARLGLRLRFTGGVTVRVYGDNEVIEVERQDAEGSDTIGSTEYDPLDRPLWRVRDDGGTLLFETGDDEGWELFATIPDPPAELAEVSIYLSDNAAREAPVSAAVDDLNQEAQGRPCAASAFTDDFEDGQAGEAWATWTFGPCEFREEAGQLRFRNMGEVYNDCGYRSRAGYDMIGDHIDVEVRPPEPESGGLNFALRIADGYSYSMRLRAGTLKVEAWELKPSGDRRLGTTEYSPETVRYWRLEHSATKGELRYLYSGDGATWTTLGATQGTDLDDTRITLFASEFATGQGEVAFDRFNLVGR